MHNNKHGLFLQEWSGAPDDVSLLLDDILSRTVTDVLNDTEDNVHLYNMFYDNLCCYLSDNYMFAIVTINVSVHHTTPDLQYRQLMFLFITTV